MSSSVLVFLTTRFATHHEKVATEVLRRRSRKFDERTPCAARPLPAVRTRVQRRLGVYDSGNERRRVTARCSRTRPRRRSACRDRSKVLGRTYRPLAESLSRFPPSGRHAAVLDPGGARRCSVVGAVAPRARQRCRRFLVAAAGQPRRADRAAHTGLGLVAYAARLLAQCMFPSKMKLPRPISASIVRGPFAILELEKTP